MIPYKNFIKRADFGGQIGEKKSRKFHKIHHLCFSGWHTDLGVYLEKAMRISRIFETKQDATDSN